MAIAMMSLDAAKNEAAILDCWDLCVIDCEKWHESMKARFATVNHNLRVSQKPLHGVFAKTV
jgi:hypothetical protein